MSHISSLKSHVSSLKSQDYQRSFIIFTNGLK